MASASCFLRTLSLKWSRNDDRVVGKKQQFWCVTNKKCPKLMSEFSEIIFFSSQLFFRCTTSWSLNSFLVAIQDKTSLTWLQNSMGNTKQLTIIIDTKIRFLRVAHDELQNFLAAEEELKRPLRNAHHAISTKIASQQHQKLFKHSIFRPFKENG